MGWTDIKDSIQVKYQAGEEITLNWEEGYGSTEKPVSKTLYAVWEKDEEYNYLILIYYHICHTILLYNLHMYYIHILE